MLTITLNTRGYSPFLSDTEVPWGTVSLCKTFMGKYMQPLYSIVMNFRGHCCLFLFRRAYNAVGTIQILKKAHSQLICFSILKISTVLCLEIMADVMKPAFLWKISWLGRDLILLLFLFCCLNNGLTAKEKNRSRNGRRDNAGRKKISKKY